MKPITIRSVVRCDRGLVRKINEDAVGVLPEQGLVVLADGMGGHSAGEVASRLAVKSITRMIGGGRTESLAAAIAFANSVILQAVERDVSLKGMATTVVVGRFTEGLVEYAHVGDSRLYLWRGEQLRQLTRDHSLVQEMVDEGLYPSLNDALKAGIRNNLLTRGVGIGEELKVESCQLAPCAGDLYLFCSDGLSNMLSDRRIGKMLAGYNGALETVADQLLNAALKRGGQDNISIVLVAADQIVEEQSAGSADV
ncbi:MAG: serine/threonine-protein phosphatase [Gammaproteobacteria bacterium]|nr:serine/threonine-protein phosphatase [Gammaproteobacteria bacterium]